MHTSHQPELPIDQKWLIMRMTALDYKPNPDGVCYGISHMAMQAILAKEVDQFYRRLQLIMLSRSICETYGGDKRKKGEID